MSFVPATAFLAKYVEASTSTGEHQHTEDGAGDVAVRSDWQYGNS
jgi:hypothetical protein